MASRDAASPRDHVRSAAFIEATATARKIASVQATERHTATPNLAVSAAVRADEPADTHMIDMTHNGPGAHPTSTAIQTGPQA